MLHLPGIRKIAQCRQIVLYLPGINLHVLCRKQAEENTHARPAAWISRWNQLITGERAENRREMVILTMGSSLQLCHAVLVGLGPPNQLFLGTTRKLMNACCTIFADLL